MKEMGYKHKEISVLLDVKLDTITDWLFWFTEGGFNELCISNDSIRRVSKLENYKELIEEKLDTDIVPIVKTLQFWLKKSTVPTKKTRLISGKTSREEL